MSDVRELNEDELEKASGGSQPNSKEQGQKYADNTRVKCTVETNLGFLVQVYGTIAYALWSDSYNQYRYIIDCEKTRYIHGLDVYWLEPGRYDVKEEDIIYVL